MSLVFLVALSVSWLFGFYLLLDVTSRREVSSFLSLNFVRPCNVQIVYARHQLNGFQFHSFTLYCH